jgi:hypothetical protein
MNKDQDLRRRAFKPMLPHYQKCFPSDATSPPSARLIRTQKDNQSRLFEAKKEPSMCDYSLHDVATRPAKVGDRLVSTHFTNSLTRGFAAVGEPNVAVCLPPGTELAFDSDVRFDAAIGLLPTRKLAENVARFRYVDNGYPGAHRDALEFPSGKVVLLTRLCEGQHATVLQLPATPHPEHTHEAAEQQPERISI